MDVSRYFMTRGKFRPRVEALPFDAVVGPPNVVEVCAVDVVEAADDPEPVGINDWD